jgi:uncharacterized YigZ family protein
MAKPYRTLRSSLRHEIDKIKGSRFIATAEPFDGESVLKNRIAELRTEFPTANHHCWAWRRGDEFRYGDDGEPSGSAGRPILRRIDGLGLDRVQVVVTRIFGGVKLGTGGLVRAYSAAAGAVLERAAVVEVVPSVKLRVTVPYALDGALRSVAAAHGLTLVNAGFGEVVTRILSVPEDAADAVVAELGERTMGRATVEIDPEG